MTPEEMASMGIAHIRTIEILQRRKANFEEYLLLYIDDMEEDSDLLARCRTKRERLLAYAVIALNNRIMHKADPTVMYDVLTVEEPETFEEFEDLKVRLKLKGYVEEDYEENSSVDENPE
jgi:hypothetical protein